jgi:hypothetical protein
MGGGGALAVESCRRPATDATVAAAKCGNVDDASGGAEVEVGVEVASEIESKVGVDIGGNGVQGAALLMLSAPVQPLLQLRVELMPAFANM